MSICVDQTEPSEVSMLLCGASSGPLDLPLSLLLQQRHCVVSSSMEEEVKLD